MREQMNDQLKATRGQAGREQVNVERLSWAEAREIDPKEYDFYCAPVFGELGFWPPNGPWAWYPDKWPVSHIVALPLLLDLMQHRIYRTPLQISESTGIYSLRFNRNLRQNLSRIYEALGDSKDKGHFIAVRKGGGYALRGNPKRRILVIECDTIAIREKTGGERLMFPAKARRADDRDPVSANNDVQSA